MADSTFTQTGRDEMLRAIERFPDVVTARLRGVAEETAQRMRTVAADTLEGKLKTNAKALVDAITIEEDAANKQFLVLSKPPIGQPTSVNVWNEYGTPRMAARPYMRPAADAFQESYRRDMEAAADRAAGDVFGS